MLRYISDSEACAVELLGRRTETFRVKRPPLRDHGDGEREHDDRDDEDCRPEALACVRLRTQR